MLLPTIFLDFLLIFCIFRTRHSFHNSPIWSSQINCQTSFRPLLLGLLSVLLPQKQCRIIVSTTTIIIILILILIIIIIIIIILVVLTITIARISSLDIRLRILFKAKNTFCFSRVAQLSFFFFYSLHLIVSPSQHCVQQICVQQKIKKDSCFTFLLDFIGGWVLVQFKTHSPLCEQI